MESSQWEASTIKHQANFQKCGGKHAVFKSITCGAVLIKKIISININTPFLKDIAHTLISPFASVCPC
jgi:hypothetical protein